MCFFSFSSVQLLKPRTYLGLKAMELDCNSLRILWQTSPFRGLLNGLTSIIVQQSLVIQEASTYVVSYYLKTHCGIFPPFPTCFQQYSWLPNVHFFMQRWHKCFTEIKEPHHCLCVHSWERLSHLKCCACHPEDQQVSDLTLEYCKMEWALRFPSSC